jgi:hypothetical protein
VSVLTSKQRLKLVDLVAGALHDVRRAGGSSDLAGELADLLHDVRRLPVAEACEDGADRYRECEGAEDERPEGSEREGHG